MTQLLAAIDQATGNTSAVPAEKSVINGTGGIELHTGNAAGLEVSASDPSVLTALGLDSASLKDSANAAVDLSTGPVTLTTGTPVSAPITGATALADLPTAPANGSSFKINDTTISFYTGGSAPSAVAGTVFLSIDNDTVSDVTDAITAALGTGGTAGSASVPTTGADAGKIVISSGTGQDLDITNGTTGALASFGLTAGNNNRTYGTTTAAPISGTSALSGTASPTSTGLSSAFTASDTITVNSKTISFNSGAGTTGTAAGGDLSIDVTTGTVNDILAAIDAISGGTGSAVGTNGKVTLNAGTTADLDLSGSTGALAKLGLKAGTTNQAVAATTGLDGQTLTLGATGNSTTPTTITFGDDDAAGEVSTLDELNAVLKSNNLQASINTKGALTITTTNDAASADIPSIGGSITDAGNIFAGKTIGESVINPDSQATRASLVTQYNNVIDQIRTTAQDSSFNGINLLNGDQLKLVFNETGTSTLNITGVSFDPAGLGLGSLTGGTDFVDNAATNGVLSSLNAASQKLRSQASALGSNLSVVQVRQDFSKNLINVLQTGSSNLTLADTNEEAANSQALSTRQSIAVSALALANQSNQSVLQLLR